MRVSVCVQETQQVEYSVEPSPRDWEPSLKEPLKGSVIFPLPENHTVAVTLFKDSRTNELEDKDWTFVLEDVSPTGKRRRVACCNINMRKHASLEPSHRTLRLKLDPSTGKVASASIHLTLHSVLLREGPATDEDMQSVASLLSVNNNSDIAVLEDLDEDDITLSDHSTKQMLDLRQQMEEMTQSLTSSDIACTPNSVQSLKLDPNTPTSLPSPTTPTNQPSLGEEISPKPQEQRPAVKEQVYTSTPILDDSLKAAVFKTRTVAKRNLKPLELKSNLNNIGLDTNFNENDADKTPTAADRTHSLFPAEKDNTPVGDLLRWCDGVTREYGARAACEAGLRSGLAYCAIIHRYRPDLIDFSGLQPEDAEGNLKVALEASAALGLPKVLCPADVLRPTPDKLAIMTYLFQLRAYFTDNELQVEQLGNDETESSYLVGRHDTDGALPRDLFSREVATRRSRNLIPRQINGPSPERGAETARPVSSPNEPKPTAQWFAPLTPPQPITRPERLMTRKELTDPFGSDEEDESPQHIVKNDQKPHIEPATTDPLNCLAQSETDNQTPLNDNRNLPADNRNQPGDNQSQPVDEDGKAQKAPTPELPKPTPQLLSRHDELKERARQLLEATKREAREKDRLKRQSSKEKENNEVVKENGLRNGEASPKKPMTEEERQAMLRERARKLIADARAGILSPTSPLSPSRTRPTLEIISKQSLMEEIAAAGGGVDLVSAASPSRRSRSPATPDADDLSSSSGREGRGSLSGSPLRSFSALVDRLTPDKDIPDENRETGSYIQSELEALEREQKAVDERAAALEKQLRQAMEANGNTDEEDRLMSQWFNLVNKKNALLRRQMQLNILEQEEDLSRRCELLARELRLSLGVDEWRKTPGQKRRERLLLQELLSAVNERDRLVQEMDEQEKAIADDDAIERNLSQVEIQRKNNCILQ
ncbi:hypothetical protein evm_003518 [Chilo suppressalis]|nr:hypothetical protein evm_003518 [Chilo suppressalis]